MGGASEVKKVDGDAGGVSGGESNEVRVHV